jgi:hypothetical protein
MLLPSLSDPLPSPCESRTWEDALVREYGRRLVEPRTIVPTGSLNSAGSSVSGLLWGTEVVQAVVEMVTGR